MGLNLRIKRIIFTSLMRMNGEGRVQQISDTEIRQIGGRAGRFKENGLIACVKPRDLMYARFALKDVNMFFEKKMMQKNNKTSELPLLDDESSSDDELLEDNSAEQKNSSPQKLLTRK